MSVWGNRFNKLWCDNLINHYAGKSEPQALLEPQVAKLGKVYRAQMPFHAFRCIADFAIPDLCLLIEIDGKEHRQAAKRRKDEERDGQLARAGWITVRVTNERVLADPEEAMAYILEQLKKKSEV